MEMISFLLRWIFTYIFYPLIIIAIFAFIAFLIFIIIDDYVNSSDDKIRISTASILPWIIFIFWITYIPNSRKSIVLFFSNLSSPVLFLSALFVGFFSFSFFKKIIAKKDIIILKSIISIFLSFIDVFIMYCIIERILSEIHFILLGLVIGFAVNIVLEGFD